MCLVGDRVDDVDIARVLGAIVGRTGVAIAAAVEPAVLVVVTVITLVLSGIDLVLGQVIQRILP